MYTSIVVEVAKILFDVPGTRNSSGFFTQLTEVIKDGLGRYFSGRPDLKIIAEPGTCLRTSEPCL